MTRHFTRSAAILSLSLLAIPVFASRESHLPGGMLVNDDAKLFAQPGIDRAKKTMSDTTFHEGLSVRVSTFEHPPESKKAEVEAAKNDPAKWKQFMSQWVKEQAPNEGAKGIFILICRTPGGIGVIADKQTRERGFTDADEQHVHDVLTKAFRDSYAPEHKDKPESAAIRDAGLLAATDYIIHKLKDTTVKAAGNEAAHRTEKAKPTASPLMGYICMGIVGLLGAWLVIGIIRALRGGGGAGGAGGGGFMTSLFGGLFGAMAGMWLYSSLFGGGGMFGGGSDAYGGDGGGMGDGGNDGAGDYGGESGAGGGFDGGGGDWGGGGDF